MLFPALHEEKSKRPAHSPPRVTHAHWWQQLGTGPTDSAARPKMNKNLAGASLPVSLHWYIKPGEKRQHHVPCGISQQGSSPISDLRGSGDLYLWMCFSVRFPFNDAEERNVNTKEDISVTPYCSGFWQQSDCCLKLAGKITMVGFVGGFLRKEKTASTENRFNSGHKMFPDIFLKNLKVSKCAAWKCLLLHGHTLCPRDLSALDLEMNTISS